MKFGVLAVAAAAACLVNATAALASGALWCNADDKHIKLIVETGVTHGMGGPFFNFKAAAELRPDDVPAGFRTLTLDEKLVHSWLDGDEARLLFYTERSTGEFSSVTLTVETTGDTGEDELKGQYELSLYEAARSSAEDGGTKTYRGEVTCGAE
jgi:hypothetical protein